ncbi:MAG: hypothetical protein H6591_08560 [Flavobacteriales bacterium]|nr:hypothetical protein [Flavobacteriales bacterium]
MVVEAGTLGPITPIGGLVIIDGLQPVIVTKFDPAVVVIERLKVIFDGRVGVFQFGMLFPAAVPVTDAGMLIVKVVAFTMEAIVAPTGMFGPEMSCPTTIPWVVLGAEMVTVVLPEVVVAVNAVSTGVWPTGAEKAVKQGGTCAIAFPAKSAAPITLRR